MPVEKIKEFLKLESAAGIILFFAAVLGVVFENSFLKFIYSTFLELPLQLRFGEINIDKPLVLWINDGLMAIFFLLVGLEVKREFIAGELSSVRQIMLPLIAAIGGMAGPAIVYVMFNLGDEGVLRGWAVPAATDIAFALGVLALLGSRAPLALKVLLTTIAIFDDLGAILIIAFFYTDSLNTASLSVAGIFGILLYVLNRIGVKSITPYMIVGILLWVAVLKSGVHATLAGVVIALAIPMKGKTEGDKSPLISFEHDLHPWVAYLVLPVFAFANSGINLSEISLSVLSSPVALGVMLGLVIGKSVGVFSIVYVAERLGFVSLPDRVGYPALLGLSFITGIGFTMSIFISGLAFQEMAHLSAARVAIVFGSLTAGTIGYLILLKTLPKKE